MTASSRSASFTVYRISDYQVVDERCESLGSVFLEEVSRAFDDGVWLTFGAGHACPKNSFAPRCDRVAIAKRREEWLVEVVEYFPGLAIRRLLTPDQCRHDPRAGVVALVRKRRAIGVQFGAGQFAYGGDLQDVAAVELGHGLAVFQPPHESFLELEFSIRVRLVPLTTDDNTVIAWAGGQRGIAGDDASKPTYSVPIRICPNVPGSWLPAGVSHIRR